MTDDSIDPHFGIDVGRSTSSTNVTADEAVRRALGRYTDQEAMVYAVAWSAAHSDSRRMGWNADGSYGHLSGSPRAAAKQAVKDFRESMEAETNG